MLGSSVLEADVLDLFAGSGALGIEALSRGARRTIFVDRDEGAVEFVRRNLAALGYMERALVVVAEATRWLSANPAAVGTCRVVLVDPPYNDAVLDRSLAALDRFCSPSTVVVVEHSRRQSLPELGRLRPLRHKRYGDTAVTVLSAE